jgi:hypothetical protein
MPGQAERQAWNLAWLRRNPGLERALARPKFRPGCSLARLILSPANGLALGSTRSAHGLVLLCWRGVAYVVWMGARCLVGC